MRTLETRFSRFTLDDDGIVTARPTNSGLPRTGEMMDEILKGWAKLVRSDPRPALWIPEDSQLQPRAWHSLVDHVGDLAVAVAILADDAADRSLGAFAVPVDSMLLPVRVFGKESEARQWLMQFATSVD